MKFIKQCAVMIGIFGCAHLHAAALTKAEAEALKQQKALEVKLHDLPKVITQADKGVITQYAQPEEHWLIDVVSLYSRTYTEEFPFDIHAVATDGSGKRIVLVGNTRAGDQGMIIIKEQGADNKWKTIFADLTIKDQSVYRTAMSGSGDCIAIGTGNEVRIMEQRKDGKWVRVYRKLGLDKGTESINSMTMSQDGSNVIVTFSVEQPRIFERGKGGSWQSRPYDLPANVTALSKDGNYAVSHDYDSGKVFKRKAGKGWELNDEVQFEKGGINTIAISARGQCLAMGGGDNKLYIAEQDASGKWEDSYTHEYAAAEDQGTAFAQGVDSVAVGDDCLGVAAGFSEGMLLVLERKAHNEWGPIFESAYVGPVSVAMGASSARIVTWDGENMMHILDRTPGVPSEALPLLSAEQVKAFSAIKLNQEQYNFINNLYIAFKAGMHGVIVLSEPQLKIFKTLPLDLRMRLKTKYKLTISEVAERVRGGRKEEKKQKAEREEEKKG
jgi:hypothetical protein